MNCSWNIIDAVGTTYTAWLKSTWTGELSILPRDYRRQGKFNWLFPEISGSGKVLIKPENEISGSDHNLSNQKLRLDSVQIQVKSEIEYSDQVRPEPHPNVRWDLNLTLTSGTWRVPSLTNVRNALTSSSRYAKIHWSSVLSPFCNTTVTPDTNRRGLMRLTHRLKHDHHKHILTCHLNNNMTDWRLPLPIACSN